MAHFVVIGAGQAGFSLVAELRKSGFEGDITLIGEEAVPPYQRPPLSKGYLLGDLTKERLFLRPESFYNEQNITLRLGQTVTEIDRDKKRITLGGEMISYDQLAITTGSAPRQLPPSIGGTLANVFCVRNLADADAMAPFFQTGKRLLVVGGGYVGLEAAAVAAKKGVDVTLIEMADRILGRVAAKETADYFRALHQAHDVTIREGLGLDHLIGTEQVEGAKFSDGTTEEFDFVVVGIGIAPNITIAKLAGLETENGIKTNVFGQTSDPAIWAAGDCAAFPYRGQITRLESVPNAIDQAEVVARNMLGQNVEYSPNVWFWSDQYDTKLQIAGLNVGYDQVIVRHAQGSDAVSHWYFARDQLLAVDAMNDPRAYMIGKRLIEAGKTAPKDVIQDPDGDLKALLK